MPWCLVVVVTDSLRISEKTGSGEADGETGSSQPLGTVDPVLPDGSSFSGKQNPRFLFETSQF